MMGFGGQVCQFYRKCYKELGFLLSFHMGSSNQTLKGQRKQIFAVPSQLWKA